MTTEQPRIRSYVLRQGRVSNAQRRAHDTLLPRLGLEFGETALDLDAVFGRRAPRILEIGCGMGETTAAIAAAHPECDYIGIEVHTPGVGSLLKRVGLHIFFPDPWPKKRQQKRRLIQPPFIALAASRLKPGAYLHAATDWQEYAEQILAVFGADPVLENTATGYAEKPAYRPQTKFETRGLKLGHGVWDIVFRRKP